MAVRIVLAIALAAAMVGPAAAAGDQRLVLAAARSDVAVVRQLLNQRVDVNAADGEGTTPLHWSVWADNLTIADELIRAGARVTTANAFGVTPVYLAAEHGNAAMVRRLLDAGANVNTADQTGDTDRKSVV